MKQSRVDVLSLRGTFLPARLGCLGLVAILILTVCRRSEAEQTTGISFGYAAAVGTTDGRLAMTNLDAQIDGLLRRRRTDPGSAGVLAGLIATRGRLKTDIADYERIAVIAAEAVTAFPQDPRSHLLQAQADALFHRFDAALAEVSVAEQLRAKPRDVAAARAGILQAKGRYDEAIAIRRRLAEQHATIDTLGTLAALEGERGNWQVAEHLFDEALVRYRDVSPFPVAWLLFERGNMWIRQGSIERARVAFQAAWERLPDYARAQGHLAEAEAALGNLDRAIELLQPLAAGPDPDYAAQLARILDRVGRRTEADHWRRVAASGFDQLTERYPAAFADHAAEFWLQAGGDPARALKLARLNLAVRQTPRAYDLVLEAARAAGDTAQTCAAEYEP